MNECKNQKTKRSNIQSFTHTFDNQVIQSHRKSLFIPCVMSWRLGRSPLPFRAPTTGLWEKSVCFGSISLRRRKPVLRAPLRNIQRVCAPYTLSVFSLLPTPRRFRRWVPRPRVRHRFLWLPIGQGSGGWDKNSRTPYSCINMHFLKDVDYQ